MTTERWSDEVGSVAEEAGRLLESLRRAGREAADDASPQDAPPDGTRGAGTGRASTDAPPADAATDGFTCDDPVCQWCPVCRVSAVVRRLSPETLSGLAELAGFAATVLGDLASAREREQGRASDHQDGDDGDDADGDGDRADG